MLTPPPSWRSWFDGEAYTLIPPMGAQAGAVRYTERVRPVRAIADIARDLAASDPDLEIVSLGAPEAFQTDEGEHAMLLVAHARLAGQPIVQVFGVVFADDFYALTLGVSRAPEHDAFFVDAVRRLVQSDAHFLGVRRRLFLYQPPAGWAGAPSGLFHRIYRHDNAELTVSPAVPALVPRTALVEQVLSALLGDPTLASEPLRAPEGLTGRLWSHRDGDKLRLLVLLEDDRYVYQLLLDAPAAEARAANEILAELVASVEPVPRPLAQAQPHRDEIGSLWVD